MYCKKCGCKINADNKKCPECGWEAVYEYCGGFWDLANSAKSVSSVSMESELDENLNHTGFNVYGNAENKKAEETAGLHKLIKRLKYAVIALLLLLVLQTVCIRTFIAKENMDTNVKAVGEIIIDGTRVLDEIIDIPRREI